MTTNTLIKKVQLFALLSRLAVILLQTVSNAVIPDHEADAFVSPPDPGLPHMWGDTVVEFMFGGMVRWDAQYFIHIAQYGYSHENSLVFFPFFPMLIRGIGTVIHLPLQLIANYHSCLILAVVLLNLFLFVKTAVILFKLSKEVLNNETLAYKAALLFCISPASIFFSAPYSECLYSFFAFSALLELESKDSAFTPIQFALASATRANGIVNAGFLIYQKLCDCSAYFHKIRYATTESGQLSLIVVVILTFNYTLIPLAFSCLIVLLPFGLYQAWCYLIYCKEDGTNHAFPPHLELFLRGNFLHSPDLEQPDWCSNFPPISYSHIQEKYWDVGVFRYYELKQIPNFLLALPVVMIVICHAALYMVDNSQVCLNFGIPPPAANNKKPASNPYWVREGINSWRVFVYTCHSLALCIFCVLCIHVQVTTRLLCSSSPVVYWFAAHLISEVPSSVATGKESVPLKRKTGSTTRRQNAAARAENYANQTKRFGNVFFTEFPKHFWGQIVLSYFVLYFFLGTVLFSNFLPWS